MASPVRTRHKSASPMSDYLGRGKEMSPTELPTSRDILRYCLLLRETLPEFKTNQSIRVMMDKVLEVTPFTSMLVSDERYFSKKNGCNYNPTYCISVIS